MKTVRFHGKSNFQSTNEILIKNVICMELMALPVSRSSLKMDPQTPLDPLRPQTRFSPGSLTSAKLTGCKLVSCGLVLPLETLLCILGVYQLILQLPNTIALRLFSQRGLLRSIQPRHLLVNLEEVGFGPKGDWGVNFPKR